MPLNRVRVLLRRLAHAADLALPQYATGGSAGADVCAALEADVVLRPGARALVPTGLCVELPAGYEMQVRPRSGLAARSGVTLLNSPGTIDADYRGEVKVLMINLGAEDVTIRRGDRIAQFVVTPVVAATFEERESLAGSERGEGGFGSTGVRERA